MRRKKSFLICAFLGAILVPFLPLLLWSISDSWRYPALIPARFGLRAWRYLWADPGGQFAGGLLSSLSLATLTAAISLFLGIPAGRALGLYHFSGKNLTVVILALPLIVPPFAVSMGIHRWFLHLQLTETFWGVLLIHATFSLPYAIFVLWGTFSDYNPEFEDQARSLGASSSSVFFHVTLPMILPGAVVAMLFAFLVSWAQYLGTLIIGGGRVLTLPLLLFSLMDSGDRPVAAAVSLVFTLPALIALFISAHNLGKTGMQGWR